MGKGTAWRGVLLCLGAVWLLGTAAGARVDEARRDRDAGGYWLAGDHHIHTMFSPDGAYSIEHQVAQAVRHGLSWCVITDHGGPRHDRVVLEQAHPALLEARKKYPQIVVYQGLEWNIPAAEHGAVILPVSPDEGEIISEFEARFDPQNRSRQPHPGTSEYRAIAGLSYLESLARKPLFFAHHPARRGLDSPRELRNWSDAAPNVARGMEGAPGHQAATLNKVRRGSYGVDPGSDAFPGFPPEAYRTHGGFDWFITRVGGVWDSLLAEGRAWFITANSDNHRHYTETREVDRATYDKLGHTTLTDRRAILRTGVDFWPGEYSKTIVHAPSRDPDAILEALRAGRMFTVHGDLIDRLDFTVQAGDRRAGMGETLRLPRGRRTATVRIRFRLPDRPNGAGRLPRLHHMDLIVGELGPPAADRNRQEDPSARVAAVFTERDWKPARDGGFELNWRLAVPASGAYLRLRGTNREVAAPPVDGPETDPWNDLWFYSNPVFVRPAPSSHGAAGP